MFTRLSANFLFTRAATQISLLKITLILLVLIQGCGFHLRGKFSIPTSLQVLQISPNQPLDAFQRSLKSILQSNGVLIVEANSTAPVEHSTLNIASQTQSERTIAYGSDGQPNRSIVELKISYEVTDMKGKIIVSGTTHVERELMIAPNALLGTENQRTRLLSDLSLDAASQIARQLSACTVSAPSL